MATEHPCKGRSKAQVKAFELIAINEHPNCTQKTLDALEKDGLIVRSGTRVLGRDAFGDIAVPDYEVPISVHMQWCQWADENYDGDEI